MKVRTIFTLTMRASKSRLTRERGRDFYASFRSGSRRIFEEILPEVPDIGRTLFRLNYDFGVCYIAWYRQLLALGVPRDAAVREIWSLTEDFLRLVPRPVMRIIAPFYLRGWRRKAPAFERLGVEGRLHPFDFRIRFTTVDRYTFGIDFYECGMRKLFARFDTLALMPGDTPDPASSDTPGFMSGDRSSLMSGLMPGVCRIDYLMFSYMGVGFVRDRTLGDGDDRCNCLYSTKGRCEWAPEKGFRNRK